MRGFRKKFCKVSVLALPEGMKVRVLYLYMIRENEYCVSATQ